MLLSSILIPIILSVFGVFIIGKIVTDPIRGLVNEVRKRSGRTRPYADAGSHRGDRMN